jgi:arylformamidase
MSGNRIITRRAILGGALAAMSAGSLQAQQMQTFLPRGIVPKPKGPRVFLDYDQEELDTAYVQGPWAPNADALREQQAQRNAATVARLGPPRQLSYGPTAIERLSLYTTERSNAPIHVLIHGGAWRVGSAARSLRFAEAYVDRGAHFIAVDFTSIDDAHGNLMTMVEQVRRAVAWIYRNAESFGGDSTQIYLSGHSSGGHLAATVLTTDWERDYGLPATPLKAAVVISGMYDLYPVSLSARREYVAFTPEVVDALSAIRHLDRLTVPVVVGYGTNETPEFQRQTREFVEAVRTAGKPIELLVGEGYNHFEMFNSLADPYGLMGRAMLRLMGLAAA